MATESFEVGDSDFLLNGTPFRIIGGAMHYFRIHPANWRDRLRKMRMMGINTLDTYVAWNMHEPSPGEFKFDEWLDIEEYIRLAGEEGLKVIIRPGPYICAEWEFGGHPAWLLKDPEMRLRSSYQPYLDATSRFFKALLPRIAPLQVHRGGPVIMVQLENEYGAYGNDKQYLESLRAMLIDGGIEVPLFTCDWAEDAALIKGTLDGVFKAINFDKNPLQKFAKLREHQPKGPLMVSEFWVGWFDQWGGKHSTKASDDVVACLDEMLKAGASFTMYLFHGGTNFGFMNGANHYEEFQPTITSYDYDNPLSEAGDITLKYLTIRKLLASHLRLPPTDLPPPAPKLSVPALVLRLSASLLSSLPVLSSPTALPSPRPMELFDQSFGFILYRTSVPASSSPRPLSLRVSGMRDRAHVTLDGRLAGILDYHNPAAPLRLPPPSAGSHAAFDLAILVENMGRSNFGPRMSDRKGVEGAVSLDGAELRGWDAFPLPLDAPLHRLHFAPDARPQPLTFYRGTFTAAAPLDTFLALPGWGKGVAWVNGFNLGRYWSIGPQQTLYVPAPVLKEGENELVVLELDGANTLQVELRDTPQLETQQQEQACSIG